MSTHLAVCRLAPEARHYFDRYASIQISLQPDTVLQRQTNYWRQILGRLSARPIIGPADYRPGRLSADYLAAPIGQSIIGAPLNQTGSQKIRESSQLAASSY